jgi:conjugal transfer pilus assembly protein TraV
MYHWLCSSLRPLWLLGTCMVISACTSVDLGGLGAETKFNCQAPQGVACLSVSGLYANASAGTLPSQNSNATSAGTAQPAPVAPAPKASSTTPGLTPASPALMAAPFSGQALRSGPKVLRIWVAPIEDADGDLHDQRFMYVTVNTGRWMIEANRLNIQRQFKPVIKLGQSSADDGDGGEESQAAAASNPRANARRAAEEAATRSPAARSPGQQPGPQD